MRERPAAFSAQPFSTPYAKFAAFTNWDGPARVRTVVQWSWIRVARVLFTIPGREAAASDFVFAARYALHLCASAFRRVNVGRSLPR